MLLALLLACSGAVKDHVPPDDSAPQESAPGDSGGGGDDSDAGPSGDTLDDPIPIAQGQGRTKTSDAIDPEGDLDCWSVELEAGELLRVQTSTVGADPEDPGTDCDGTYDTDPLDTVLDVYDPSGERIASSDDYPLGLCGRDSLALIRAETAGTYVIAVTDWNDWDQGGELFGNPPAGGPDYTYDLYTERVTASGDGGALTEEPALALLEGGTVRWDLEVDSRAWLTLFHPLGTNADVAGLVYELDDADGQILARADSDAFYGVRWGLGLTAPLEPGNYSLSAWVEDPDAPGAWTWVWSAADAEVADNGEAEPDDDLDAAIPLATRAGDGEYEGEYVQATFDGWIAAGDTDVFSAEVSDGQYLYLTVYVGQVGSTLRDAVALIDVDGETLLASADADSPTISAKRAGGDGSISVAIQGEDAAQSGYYLGYLEIWNARRPW